MKPTKRELGMFLTGAAVGIIGTISLLALVGLYHAL